MSAREIVEKWLNDLVYGDPIDMPVVENTKECAK